MTASPDSLAIAGNSPFPILDLRMLPPPERHARIFHLLGMLDGGETLTLINDHDPLPLHRQLEWVQPGVFSWEYLAEGPDVWQVRIGRRESAGCNCTCGSH
ncbi:DUF2249 domain-containing protein [Gellertiella hungarica]|uniref:Uncharacterized protein (DUF2249 family) n=1 Tax=Gellertiella hungarica TaxID=1572859 RepID=A0A7W6J7N2_9HYPH|nr:DUF2249 domain-containing protein [Gellertiella hungarica]MBB4065388.1 uncharacterized protein (DUF2249 family) [Gellertiella hungarica]